MTPSLLLEGVKKAMRKWERAHDRLHNIARKGHKEYERGIEDWEARRPDETPEQHGQRLRRKAGDVDQSLHDKIFSKRQSKLELATTEETRRREALAQAEAKREAKQRRKALMKAPVPSLEPEQPAKVRTVAAVQRAAPHVISLAQRPKKLSPVRKRA